MVDRLQDGAGAVRNISILPVERYAVIRAILVPEAQCCSSRHRPELLIERAVSQWLVAVLLAIGVLLRVAACERGMSSTMHKVGSDCWIVAVAVKDPRRKGAGLESFVNDQPCVARCDRCRRSRR